MIIHDHKQGSLEWAQARLGTPTASCFEKIITPSKLELSSQADGYISQLVAESLLQRQVSDIGNLEWVARGKELEPDAVAMYEFLTGNTTQEVGFCTTDDGKIGASPDRLVGDDGLLEFKCPAPITHVGYLRNGFGKDYLIQAQGQMFVTGRKWVDRISYHPELPMHIERTERNDEVIAKIEGILREFVAKKDTALEQLRQLGNFSEREAMINAADMAALEQQSAFMRAG